MKELIAGTMDYEGDRFTFLWQALVNADPRLPVGRGAASGIQFERLDIANDCVDLMTFQDHGTHAGMG
ncbi:hypothetical protein LGN12_22000, partial [Burkholderia multivorans]|nr:hypothetical protein [Burkholderia multivorans]